MSVAEIKGSEQHEVRSGVFPSIDRPQPELEPKSACCPAPNVASLSAVFVESCAAFRSDPSPRVCHDERLQVGVYSVWRSAPRRVGAAVQTALDVEAMGHRLRASEAHVNQRSVLNGDDVFRNRGFMISSTILRSVKKHSGRPRSENYLVIADQCCPMVFSAEVHDPLPRACLQRENGPKA